MKAFRVLALMFAVSLTISACSGSEDAGQPTPSPAASADAEPVLEDFDSGNFTASTQIDNPWMPMAPGSQWVYEGTTTEDGETFAHRIEFTVTDLTKEIAGVDTVVAWIVDNSDGEVVEKEIAFYAQDDDGNVWYFGEHPEEYEDGELIDAPTWIAEHDDARAGIKMRAEPELGTPRYFQGWAPAVEWTDFGVVDDVGQETCVPVDCYEDVLVIAESSLDEEGAFQLKYFARDVGEVRVGWRGDDASTEELELVEFRRLSADDLEQIRTEALMLEESAYDVSPDVYGSTTPAR